MMTIPRAGTSSQACGESQDQGSYPDTRLLAQTGELRLGDGSKQSHFAPSFPQGIASWDALLSCVPLLYVAS